MCYIYDFQHEITDMVRNKRRTQNNTSKIIEVISQYLYGTKLMSLYPSNIVKKIKKRFIQKINSSSPHLQTVQEEKT